MVFDHDWFATPFVMMTCQVGYNYLKAANNIEELHIIEKLIKDNGEFEEPDWDTYSCVYRKYYLLPNLLIIFQKSF